MIGRSSVSLLPGCLPILSNPRVAIAACLVGLGWLSGHSYGQQSPSESLQSLHVPEGLEVQLWASEPMVNNPTAMDIDSKGRVWIAEGLNYRMKLKTFDDLSRIDGADRIKILTDSDGDGTADQVTVFADQIFPVPLGLAVEEIWTEGRQTGTRVYVGNSPDLLVLEDTDGDDKADRRYSLLTGFRGVDSDHGLHGMTFGPDGKLYLTVGDGRYGADQVQAREPTFDVVDKSGRHVRADNFGTTLRVNRDGSQLQVMTSGHRNNYEAAVDSFGNVFGSDNDDDGNRGCRMYWVIDGGKYGYQHPESNRHWAEEIPGVIPKLVGTGNGAPCGLLVYEATTLPGIEVGSVLQIDAGTHQVNLHPLIRHGAGFRSDYQVLLKGDDAWFRPSDLTVAPDGSLFVCDWYDAGVGGNRFSDQTTGRIYRITASDKTKRVVPASPSEDPIRALQSPNACVRLAARDLLLQRGSASRDQLLELWKHGQPHHRARALHVLFDLPETGTNDAIAALSDDDPRMREAALQLLARDVANEFLVEAPETIATDPPGQRCLESILPLAADSDASVRRTLLLALRRVPTPQVEDALKTLIQAWDGQDRYYLEAIRSAVVDREETFVAGLFEELAAQAIAAGWEREAIAAPPYYPIGTNDAFLRIGDQLAPANPASKLMGIAWVLRRSEAIPAIRMVLRANASPSVEHAGTAALCMMQTPAAGTLLLERYSSGALSSAAKQEILQQLGTHLTGDWGGLRESALLQEAFGTALQDRELQLQAIAGIAKGGLSEFAEDLMRLVDTPSMDEPIRAAALTALGKLRHPRVMEVAQKLAKAATGQPSAGVIELAALETLHQVEGNEALIQVLGNSRMPLDARRRSLQLVTQSMPGVNRVMTMRERGSFPDDLQSELVFLLHNHSDRRVRQMALEALPLAAANSEQRVHSYQAILNVPGDAARGRELFEKNQDAACARCHRVDGGGTLVGPDLSSVGTKYDARELLYHIQNPSGAINYNFVAHSFLLSDGRVISGLVLDRTNQAFTLGIATGQQITIDVEEVEEERPQAASLMPEGLLGNFTTQQAADLIEYLQTLRQGNVVVESSR